MRTIPLLLALIIIGTAMSASACGDDDNPATSSPAGATGADATKAYFQETLANDLDGKARTTALDGKYPKAFKGDVQQTKDSYREYVGIFDDSIARERGELVPEDLKEFHDRGVELDAAISGLNHSRLQLLEQATTAAAVDLVFADDPAYTAAVQAANDYCREVTTRADAVGVTWHPCEG